MTSGEFVLSGRQKTTPRKLKSLIITELSTGFIMSTQTDSPERLPLIHPGEILLLDFLEPMAITAYRLSKDIGVTQARIGEILAGKRSITADTALRLSRYFGNSAEFWLNLQIHYDLRQASLENADVYNQIPLAVVS
jgi:addiction module HigA family antidote